MRHDALTDFLAAVDHVQDDLGDQKKYLRVTPLPLLKTLGGSSNQDFAALPGVTLDADVLTPYFGPYYYQTPDQEDPAVWHDPNPVAFLAVAAGITFRFVVTARTGKGFAQEGDFDNAESALSHALAWLGAGAKTSNGYGRFETDALRDLFSF